MTVDDVREQLTQLRVSVDSLAETVGVVKVEVEDVRKEQRRSSESHKLLHAETKGLHQEHLALVDKLRVQEKIVEVHIRDYERGQERNEIIHAHMTGATMALQEELREFRGEFRAHDKEEAQDRKNALAAQKTTNESLKTTFLTVAIGGGGLFVALLGILVTLWIHSSGAIG